MEKERIDQIKERILYIFLKENEQQVNKIFEKLHKKVDKVKIMKMKLEMILKYFSDFLYDSHKEDIKKLADIIENLKNNPLNLYSKKKR